MGLVQYINDNNPILNIPDLLNIHHDNPLGIPPVALLLFIFVVVEVMGFFNYKIRNKGKSEYYPVLYSLLAVSLIAIYYYCFQSGFPTIDIKLPGQTVSKPVIGWFCQAEVVGWPIAIVSMIALAHVCYVLLCAVMQTTAQLTVEANMIEGKKWKEWKALTLILLLGVLVIGVCSYITDFIIVSSWAILIELILMVVFVLAKIIADTIRMKNFKWGFLIGVTFFVGCIATMMLIIDCFRGLLFFLVIFMAFFSRVKASKKQPKE